MPVWHPFAVHFPIALTLASALLLLLSRVIEKSEYAQALATAGTVNLCLGAVAALFALMTGLGAVVGLDMSGAAREAVGSHVRWGIFSSLALVLLAVWRGAGVAPNSRPSPWFLAILLGASLGLIVTGYRGTQNIFEHGVGLTHPPAKK